MPIPDLSRLPRTHFHETSPLPGGSGRSHGRGYGLAGLRPVAVGLSPPQLKVDQSQLPRSTGAITSFAPVVDKVAPSMVTVYATRDAKQQPNNPAAGNPMLRRFFGIPDDQDNGNGEEEGGEEGGRRKRLGSGVIVSADGLILTNNHVAEAGDEIMVRIGGDTGMNTRRRKSARIPAPTSRCSKSSQELPVITFADSDKVKVGDIALAVGNPFGLTNR